MADQGILLSNAQPLNSDQLAPRTTLGLTTTAPGVGIKSINNDVPGLRKRSVKALMAQIAYLETGDNIAYSQGSRFGRYATHLKTLINYGYVGEDGETWTGKGGIDSIEAFLLSRTTQDDVMERFLTEQYTSCVTSGVMKPGDSKDVVGGLLAVAYQFQDHISTYRTSFFVPNEKFSIASVSRTDNIAFVNTYPTAHTLGSGRQVVVETSSNVDLNGTQTVGNVVSQYVFDYTSTGGNIASTVDTGTVTSSATYPVTSIGSADRTFSTLWEANTVFDTDSIIVINNVVYKVLGNVFADTSANINPSNIEEFGVPNGGTVSDVTLNSNRSLFSQGTLVQVNGASSFNGIYEIHTITDTDSNTTFRLGKAISSNVASGSVSKLRNVDLSYVITRTSNLATQLSNTLGYLGTADSAYQNYTDSGIGDLLEDFTITSTTPLEQRQLYSLAEDLNSSALTVTKLVQSALFSNIDGLVKQRAITSAVASITSFNTKIVTTYNSLISSKVKDWRLKGDLIVDSQGRPGSLFYNAGRYAVKTLGADISV